MTFFEMPGERVLVLLVRRQSRRQPVGHRPAARTRHEREGQPAHRAHDVGCRATGGRCGARCLPPRRRAAQGTRHRIQSDVHHRRPDRWRSAPRLFHVYSAGNFIETTADTRYFQIGESKYGKPIIDRVVKADTSLAAVAKCALISMDSTIRSNLSVGMPLDLAIVRRDALQISLHRSIGPDDAYFKVIRDGWGESLRNAFHALPDPSIP